MTTFTRIPFAYQYRSCWIFSPKEQDAIIATAGAAKLEAARLRSGKRMI